MRAFGKWLGRGLIGLAVLISLVWFFGREPVDVAARFEPRRFGEGVQVYFETVEARFDDITSGTQKRVIWAGQAETRTPVSVLYIHGFSATSEEIRPVPDRVAAVLGANLIYTRLAGHGRGSAAMAEPRVSDWMADVAEALAAARAVGENVIVLATSTGGTLMAEAALQPELSKGVRGIVFLSPNFGVNDPNAHLLTLPGMRYLLPVLVGAEHSWAAMNEAQAKYWTTRYPVAAMIPMAALVKHAVAQDYSGVSIPALFYFSDRDQVVRAEATRAIAARWGGGARVVPLPEGAEVGETAHVIAGDIVAPGNTEAAIAVILDWAAGVL
ncbi:MAG: alpha/beta hydrolase [Rhodobacterales bacterium]|nr:MAG: alpha/beta hydrolase [Rhodobacterales bacterium]